MAASFFRDYPPYLGDEPYVFLCFHKEDAQQVKPFLDGLVQRRCRVWYSMEKVLKTADNKKRTNCENNAGLMIFWLSKCAADDEGMKSRLGSYQASGRPVICIDTQDCAAQSGFSLIVTEHAKHIACPPGTTPEAIVSMLLRTEGFSQQFIAENDLERQLFLRKRRSRRIALSILAAALLLLTIAFFYAQSNDFFRPRAVIVDSVTIDDAVIVRAARFALSENGVAALTQEGLARITTLRLDTTPTSFEALEQFPALTRLEIPQSAVTLAAQLPEDAPYRIVVYPEAGK